MMTRLWAGHLKESWFNCWQG